MVKILNTIKFKQDIQIKSKSIDLRKITNSIKKSLHVQVKCNVAYFFCVVNRLYYFCASAFDVNKYSKNNELEGKIKKEDACSLATILKIVFYILDFVHFS